MPCALVRLVDLGPTFDSGELPVKVTSKLILDMISRTPVQH